MPLRKTKTVERPARPTTPRYPASIDRSAGQVAAVRRFDLTKQADVDALLAQQQEWQSSAWYYADVIGELKDAQRFIENAFRRCRLFAAFQRDPDAEAIAVADAVPNADDDGQDDSGNTRGPNDFLTQEQADQADAIISSFAARDGGQPILMGKAGVNLFTVGEFYLINRDTPIRRPNQGEDPEAVETGQDWEIRSRDELQNGGSSREPVQLVDTPGQREGRRLPADAFVERCWRKHPRYSGWADSNLRAAIGTLEEMDLLNRLARASTRSRILASIITMPDEMDFGDPDQPLDGAGGNRQVQFDKEIAEVMAAVITNEADSNSVAPLALRGPRESLKEVRVIEIPRRYGPEERAQYQEAIAKLGRTIELPMERMQGLTDANHWSAWLIDDETYSAYIEPLVGIVAETLAYGLLRPMLAESDPPWPAELIEKMVVGVDPSALVQRPDKGKVATEGYGLTVPAVSGEAWRKANGFGDDDAPNDEELQRRLAFTAGLDQAVASKVLAALGLIPDEVVAQQVAAADAMQEQTAPRGEPPDPAGGPTNGDEGPPAGGAPNARVAVAASAAPARHRLDQLSQADRTLAATVQTAVDAAMSRAQERAGARLRSLAQRSASARAALAVGDVPNHRVATTLGAGVVAALVPEDDLFAGVFDHLEGHWDAWVAAVQADGISLATALGTLTPAQRREFEEQQDEHRLHGWLWLSAALLLEARRIAQGVEDTPPDGEFDDLLAVPPVVVREALARAGGAVDVDRTRDGGLRVPGGPEGRAAGGVATGETIRHAFAAIGWPWIGYEWVYGDASSRGRPFQPHQDLGGVFFETFDSPVLANHGGWPGGEHYSPGDHLWCRCSFVPLAAPTQEG